MSAQSSPFIPKIRLGLTVLYFVVAEPYTSGYDTSMMFSMDCVVVPDQRSGTLRNDRFFEFYLIRES